MAKHSKFLEKTETFSEKKNWQNIQNLRKNRNFSEKIDKTFKINKKRKLFIKKWQNIQIKKAVKEIGRKSSF